jgi:hypothetical protein
LSGLSIGVVTASSGYVGALVNWLNPPMGGFGGDRYREDVRYTYLAWDSSNAYCNITIRNTGPIDLTIARVEMNNTTITPDAPILPCTLTKDSSITMKFTNTFNSNMLYSFMIVTAKGNQFGPIRVIAP